MRGIFILAVLCFFVYIICARAYGDIIHLKNGRQLEGKVIEETDGAVKLKIKIGQVTFQRDQIVSIEKKELPPDFFKVKTQVISQPAKKREIQQAEVGEMGLKAEGYQEASPPKFNLNVEAEFKRLFDGDAILINGTTTLPPKSVLYLIFKTSTQTIAVRKLFVEGPSFSTRIGPFGDRRIPPGSYIVEAVFSPERQESERIKKMLADAKKMIATSNITIGSPDEAREKATRRKSELTSQIKELEHLFDELNRQYTIQRRNFNEARWNTWSLKWRSQLGAIKSSVKDYRDKALVLDFPVQENVLNEIIYDLKLLWNRYAAELFKMNDLAFDMPPSNDTRDSGALTKAIQDRLKTSNKFLMASQKVRIK